MSATMISSAVIIPGEQLDQSPSHALKRKLSSSSSNENKRQRRDTTDLSQDGRANTNAPSATESIIAVSPSDTKTGNIRPPRSSLTNDQEKQRSRRLFGSVLGTLSQTAASSKSRTTAPASTARSAPYTKRDEIASRAIARQKAEQADHEADIRRRKVERDKKRREEQAEWDEEAKRLSRERERHMAGFLRTKTEPRLFYLPWELREDERKIIRRQKEELDRASREDIVEQEEVLFRAEETVTAGDEHTEKDRDKVVEDHGRNADTEEQAEGGSDKMTNEEEAEVKGSVENETEHSTGAVLSDGASDSNLTIQRKDQEDHNREDDHHIEEDIDGQEDAVIY